MALTATTDFERALRDTYVTPAEACRMAGISDPWLRSLVRRGKLAHVNTPLGRLIDRDAVEQLRIDRDARRNAA